ncbi:hypothetical protein Taro_022149 [Colocasia esculenta]|uniref:Uncharacterized protein n=1 Tax=Colocasia esculenta TaxID=4460 RepID=A0A843VDM0_COLES|nr:hypothetical protein [Colocasia esculenta]
MGIGSVAVGPPSLSGYPPERSLPPQITCSPQWLSCPLEQPSPPPHKTYARLSSHYDVNLAPVTGRYDWCAPPPTSEVGWREARASRRASPARSPASQGDVVCPDGKPIPRASLIRRGSYQHHKELKAAQGVKITAQGLEHAIAGTALYVVGPDDDLEDVKELAMHDMKTIGTPICIPSRDFIDIGRIASIEINHKQVDVAKKGHKVAIKIIGSNPEEQQKMYGRHFEIEDELVSHISRKAIDILKADYRDELSNEEWLLVLKLKKLFKIP